MSLIQVGQVLDKYELLERVGQGGMAIVYRGIDRTLKRTVAIKILHKHLAESAEARDRFEREAQAVAKLRHENILEIFDYSAKPQSESYIVTEFIDGQTLKQFITDRPIAFPEIGAMVMLQVARALAHAHAAGILHRDIKPENIMIRSDGVVKLMDFGISHMVDLERLTVTGQLLGSPAYMAPEHVEGRPLDFRTDVFAVGIVLYQLTVGKLPFEGKNPHEVLKRIAECKFVDPRIANPRMGNRLGKIMLRAMAAMPPDRYQGVGEMVIALEQYLEESGLEPDKVASELARYFKAPVPYEEALKARLVDHLSRRGQQLLVAGDQAPALDVFDRVLTIDPTNERVLAILDGLNRRARVKTAAIAVLAIGTIGAGGYMIHRRSLPPEPVPPPSPAISAAQSLSLPATVTARIEAPPPPIVEIDAGTPVAIALPDHPDVAPIDAAPPTSLDKPLRVVVVPAQGSRVKFGTEWATVTPEDGAAVRAISGDTTIVVQNPCCQEEERLVTYGTGELSVSLQALPAKVIAKCDAPGTAVHINGQSWHLREVFSEPFEKITTSFTKTFTVEFIGDKVDSTPIEVPVAANQTGTATCVVR